MIYQKRMKKTKKLQQVLDLQRRYGGFAQLLLKKDETYYNIVDKENPRRLLRALDVIWQTGKPYSEQINQPKTKRNFDA